MKKYIRAIDPEIVQNSTAVANNHSFFGKYEKNQERVFILADVSHFFYHEVLGVINIRCNLLHLHWLIF